MLAACTSLEHVDLVIKDFAADQDERSDSSDDGEAEENTDDANSHGKWLISEFPACLLDFLSPTVETITITFLVDQRFGIAREWINATDMRALEKRLCLREELKAFSVRVKLTGPAEEGGAHLPSDAEDDSWQRELVAALPKMHAIGLLQL